MSEEERLSPEAREEIERFHWMKQKQRDERITALERLLEASGNRREQAEARVQQLEEALRFYADEKNYIDGKYFVAGKVPVDQGKKARAALSPSKEASDE